jgi:hypothetical protein
MTYVTSVGPVTRKPGGFRALNVETSLRLNYSSRKELRSLNSHTVTQLEFFIFLREHSLLGKAKGPLT